MTRIVLLTNYHTFFNILFCKGSFTIVNIYVFVQSVRRGGGHDASVLFLNVDILLRLPPGGYD